MTMLKKIWDVTVIIACLLALAAIVLVSFPVYPAEDLAQQQAEKVLDMIGPHGLFAIAGSIFMVRLVRVGWYLDKQQSIIATLVISSIVGALSMYFYANTNDPKAIAGGAVMTPIGAIITYELLRAALAFAFDKLRWDSIRAIYFFLCPAPMKIKKAGEVQTVEPHDGLTQFFDRARVDSKPDSEDITRRLK